MASPSPGSFAIVSDDPIAGHPLFIGKVVFHGDHVNAIPEDHLTYDKEGEKTGSHFSSP